MKKTLFLFLLGVGLISCTNDLSIEDTNMSNSIESVSEATNVDDQSNALKAFADLKSYFSIISKSLQDEENIIKFPDYYGGCFVKEGKLVVNIKEGTKDLPAIITANPNIVVQECKYSYSLLVKIQKELEALYLSEYANLNPAINNIDMFGISEIDNRIDVYLKDCSENAISEFKHYLVDSPVIFFIQSYNLPAEVSEFMNRFESISSRTLRTVYPGSRLGAGAESAIYLIPGSLGYKATYGGKTGFVTAAHVAALNDVVHLVYDGNKSEPIAKCTFSRKSGNVDVAFCEATNCNITNSIAGNTSNTISSSIYSNIATGISVNLSGYESQSSGTIKYLGLVSGGITGLIGASYSSMDGDSGGLIYHKEGSKNYIVGIHRSRAKLNTGESVALLINANNISTLNILPY